MVVLYSKGKFIMLIIAGGGENWRINLKNHSIIHSNVNKFSTFNILALDI